MNPKLVKYNIQLLDWTTKELELLVDFADPSMISKGTLNDKIEIKVRNPTYFVSDESGEIYDKTKQ